VDIWVILNGICNCLSEGFPINGQRATRRHSRFFGAVNKQGAQQFYLSLQQPGGSINQFGAERIAAHQFG
jgi:hypothetical protein